MSSVIYEYDMSQHGINKTIKLQVRDVVNNKTPEQGFPRDQLEVDTLNQIIAIELQKNQAGLINEAASLGERRQNLINDPIGTLIKEAGTRAYETPAGPGVNIGTTAAEITKMLPGGQSPDFSKMAEGVINTGAAIIAGPGEDIIGRDLSQTDPKRLITDIGVIGTDMALAAGLLNDSQRLNPLYGNTTTKNLFFNALRKNPALGFATIVGTNVAAKYGGNLVYDKINDMTRIIMQLPDPEAAYKNNEQIRNLMDAREELIWSGGAMGLQHIFPLVKRLLGKTIGVDKNMKIQVGEVMDETGAMLPIHANMLDIAKQYNIPMNVFSTSPSGFVKGAGSVIGLFPFVATKARQAQNAQQVALAENINKILNDLSPIGLFKDANVVSNKSFKTMINKFTSTKTALYNRAFKISDKINDKFIPTARLKEVAENLELMYYGGKRDKSKTNLRLNQPDYSRPQTVDELLQGFTGKTDEFVDALIDFQYLKDDYITGRQFKRLQSQFNAMKRQAAGDPKLGTELGNVDDFTTAMIQTLNDFENFRQFDDAGKQALVNQFSGAMGIANDFFFNNVNYTKGRTAQILGLADKNIAKATGDIDSTMLTGEQVLKILFNDETLYSPAAIKEMMTAMPAVKLADGRVVDPVKAVARSYLDDQLRATTKYISGDLRITGDAGVGARGWGVLTGKEPTKSVKSGTFNIPIVDIKALKTSFGLDNPNTKESFELIFGKEQYDRIQNVLALGEQIQQTSFGDVSAFVKRRGFLGGVNAITNLAFAGFVANNPFGNVGLVLAARYGMSKMADPKFMEGLTKVMNPELSDLARRQALINTVALSPELVAGMNEGREDIPPELQNLDPGNPYDVMKYMIFMSDNNVSYPGSENMSITIGNDGRAAGVELSKVDSKNEFSIDAQGVASDIQTVQAETVGENVTPNKDPFLDVDFDQIVQNTGVGLGMEQAAKQLTDDQRIALAGGNLDQAIAMGSRRV